MGGREGWGGPSRGVERADAAARSHGGRLQPLNSGGVTHGVSIPELKKSTNLKMLLKSSVQV